MANGFFTFHFYLFTSRVSFSVRKVFVELLPLMSMQKPSGLFSSMACLTSSTLLNLRNVTCL